MKQTRTKECVQLVPGVSAGLVSWLKPELLNPKSPNLPAIQPGAGATRRSTETPCGGAHTQQRSRCTWPYLASAICLWSHSSGLEFQKTHLLWYVEGKNSETSNWKMEGKTRPINLNTV